MMEPSLIDKPFVVKIAVFKRTSEPQKAILISQKSVYFETTADIAHWSDKAGIRVFG